MALPGFTRVSTRDYYQNISHSYELVSNGSGQLCFTKSVMFQVSYVHQQTTHQLGFITSAGFQPDMTSGLLGVNKLA